MADNFCARFTTIAADDIGGAHYPRFKLTCGAPGGAVDVCSANPLPVSIISGGGSSSGGLTDTELRASAVPVSGSFYPATQPVSIAATVAVSGPLTDTQLRASAVPVSLASMPSTPVTGTFWQATQPVSGTVTVTPPTLTKGTQGATGLSVQSLIDVAIASTTQQAAALAEAGDTCVVPLPDGIEISGTQQVGLSQVCSAATGVVWRIYRLQTQVK